MTNQAGLRLLKLAQTGQMEASRFGMFCIGGVIKDLSEDVFRQWAETLVAQPDAVSVRILINLMHVYYLDAKGARKLPADLALRALGHTALFQKNGQYHTMDHYYWAAVGTAFASIHPTESLKLAETIVEHFGEVGTIIEGFHSEAHKVLREITKRNPREVWHLVSKRLGPPVDSRALRLKSWLRGDMYSGGGEGGVLPLVPVGEIWTWVDGNREERARYLASFVPKQIFRSSDMPCLAREVLIRYGSDFRVRHSLMANFSTEGWSGPASYHYRDKKQSLLDFKKEEPDANVKLWLDEYIQDLERLIDDAKVREEREAF